MTYPPNAVGRTPNFQLPFLSLGAPLRWTREILEEMTRTVDAALTRGGVAPPNAQDLVAVAGRVTALEPTTVVNLALTAGWAPLGAGFQPLRVWKAGSQGYMTGFIKAVGAKTAGEYTVAGLPFSYLYPKTDPNTGGGHVGGAAVVGSVLGRIDVRTPNGAIVVTVPAMTDGQFLAVNFFWPTV